MGRLRPPQYRECPMCHREFGSRSIDIHMRRCLEAAEGGGGNAPGRQVSDDADTEIETRYVRIEGYAQMSSECSFAFFI